MRVVVRLSLLLAGALVVNGYGVIHKELVALVIVLFLLRLYLDVSFL